MYSRHLCPSLGASFTPTCKRLPRCHSAIPWDVGGFCALPHMTIMTCHEVSPPLSCLAFRSFTTLDHALSVPFHAHLFDIK